MSEEIAITVLKELREFRAENNERWEVNRKQHEDLSARITSLEKGRIEDREYLEQTRKEDRAYLEQARLEDRKYLEGKITENKEYLEGKVAENKVYLEGKIVNLEVKMTENKEYLEGKIAENKEYLEDKITENKECLEGKIIENRKYFEETRKKDRKELMDVLDTMQKSIDRQFSELKDIMNKKVEINAIEHFEFKKQMSLLRKKN